MTDFRLHEITDPRDYVHVTTKLQLSGNFFSRDPSKTIRHNIVDMLEALAGEMQDVTRREIASHQGEIPGWSGWSLAHTEGYVAWNKRWSMWAAVGAYTLGMSAKDAIRTKAAAATIERRWHPYRNVKGAVYRARAVIGADLAKGLE